MAAADPSRGASASGAAATSPDLRYLGLVNTGPVAANRPAAELVELALARQEGGLTAGGALVAYTGSRTGRSPHDRYIVREPGSEGQIDWGGVNRPIEPAVFDRLLARVAAYLQGRPLFVSDLAPVPIPAYRLNVRVIAEKAWHTLFARCLFLRPDPAGGSPGANIVPTGRSSPPPISRPTRPATAPARTCSSSSTSPARSC